MVYYSQNKQKQTKKLPHEASAETGCADILYEHWLVSQLLHFLCSSPLMCHEKQWKMAQEPTWGTWKKLLLLALVSCNCRLRLTEEWRNLEYLCLSLSHCNAALQINWWILKNKLMIKIALVLNYSNIKSYLLWITKNK